MSDRLTAFEFIPLTDAPQLVRLVRVERRTSLDWPDAVITKTVIAQFNVQGWLGVAFGAGTVPECEARADLAIEGLGIGRPYWNGDVPSWVMSFDPATEQQRIDAVRIAARRELNRAVLTLS